MNGTALDRASIHRLITGNLPGQQPLVEGWRSLEEQLQPNGFDLSLQAIARLRSAGRMGRDSAQRELSDTEPLEFGLDGWLHLPPGPYLATFSEVVNLPLDLMALGLPRSSLLRSGVGIHTAIWDAGYQGRSQALLTVYHSAGYHLQQGARLLQLVFFRLSNPVDQGYTGSYQGENL